MTYTEELRKLVRMRKAAARKVSFTGMSFHRAIRFLECQLQQTYNPADAVQAGLIIRWWPHIQHILPSPYRSQANIHNKWKNRYEKAQRDFCHQPSAS